MDDERIPGPDRDRGRAELPDPSPRALELLDRTGAAFTALRAAHAEILDCVQALEVEHTASEFGYPSLSRLLQDHVHADRHEVTELRRHARLTHPETTPTGAITPPALPATAEAVADAAIGAAHVRVIEQAMKRLSPLPHLDPDTLAVAEEQLAGLARDRTPRGLADAAAAVCEQYDPDGAAPTDSAEPLDELRLTLRRDRSRLDGRFRFTDPEAIETVLAGFRHATPPADPRAGQLADPDESPAGPTLEQRQAQALRDLAADALDLPYTAGDDEPDDEPGDLDAELRDLLDEHTDEAGARGEPEQGRRSRCRKRRSGRTWSRARRGRARAQRTVREGGERAHIAVSIDWELLRSRLDQVGADDLQAYGTPIIPTPRRGPATPEATGSLAVGRSLPGVGHLESGVAVGPETARRLACDAEIIPMVLGSRSEPLDIGRRSRVVPVPIRRAVIARDRHCAFPGCRRHARTCEAHHVVHWVHGGPTTVENLTLLCSFHHTVVHHGGWTVRMIDGLPWFVPPRWLDPRRRPRQNRPWRTDPVPA